jgi:hypothetical protein
MVGTSYFPSWMEIMLSVGIVSAAALVFFFLVERFPVYGEPLRPPQAVTAQPGLLALLSGSRTAPARPVYAYSLAFILAAAITVGLLPEAALHGAKPRATPVHRARGAEVMLVDGNRNDDGVVFNHAQHRESLGGAKSCGNCHHMNLPFDQSSSCATCHRDMTQPTDIFNHQTHVAHLGDNQACGKCHVDNGSPKSRQSVRSCTHCHPDMWSAASLQRTGGKQLRMRMAPGYEDALHGSCRQCHQAKAKEFDVAEMGRCAFCHKPLDDKFLKVRQQLSGRAPAAPVPRKPR